METNTGFAAARLALRQIFAISRRILTEYLRQRRSLVFWAWVKRRGGMFERGNPEGHQSFLGWLGLPAEKTTEIRRKYV